ncbi:unnamed protein product, partial [Mesorhabditis belari]|uniref:Uncharacterized protein n=1 Tax=Mesorhabditis belari TaxID=2138241 RepID=A0AAF3J458_9BILA
MFSIERLLFVLLSVNLRFTGSKVTDTAYALNRNHMKLLVTLLLSLPPALLPILSLFLIRTYLVHSETLEIGNFLLPETNG